MTSPIKTRLVTATVAYPCEVDVYVGDSSSCNDVGTKDDVIMHIRDDEVRNYRIVLSAPGLLEKIEEAIAKHRAIRAKFERSDG